MRRSIGVPSKSGGPRFATSMGGTELVDIASLERDLADAIEGEVRFDALSRALYATDASNFRQPPIGVVIPRTPDDVVAAHRVCRDHGAPILSRGCGTSLSGETVNHAVVIDHSKHLDRIDDPDPEARTVRVQSGAINERINAHAGRWGLVFGPDPSTHAYCTLGGNVGNNSCGTHSVQARLHGEGSRTSFNVAAALCGTEGTCVTVLEATLKLIELPKARSLLVIGYPSIYAVGDHLMQILEACPIACEGIDHRLYEYMRGLRQHLRELPLLPQGSAWVLVEFGADTKEEADDRARELKARLERDRQAPAGVTLFDDPAQERRRCEVREGGLGAEAFPPTGDDRFSGWEDSAVAPEDVGRYLRDLERLYEKYGYEGALYGHLGDGCIHSSISFDLRTADGVRAYRSFVEEAADLVVSYGGSLSGEHGDGQQRAELLPKMFGEELVEAFRGFKRIWDPDWKMNPGKVVDAYRLDEALKLGTSYNPW